MGSGEATRELSCGCGASSFTVRIDRDEQVGLLTCTPEGHHSLLLDSRDYWDTVIQDGRPKELKCRCKAGEFLVRLIYAFRDDSPDVRGIEVHARCTSCDADRLAATFEINYGPTTLLVERPLDPCPQPWLKAKYASVGGYWTIDDVIALVQHAGQLDARIHFGLRAERPSPMTPLEAAKAVQAAKPWSLWLSAPGVELPDKPRDAWKRLPILHLHSYRMVLEAGTANRYCLEWAMSTIRDGKIVPQDAAFLDLTKRILAWLPTHFVGMNKTTFHSASEMARLGLA